MGQSFFFRCTSCEFETAVSGGRDAGMAYVTQTYSCDLCGILFDHAVAVPPFTSGERAPDRLPCYQNPKYSEHFAELWNHPGPCPRCGNTLDRSDGPVTHWD
jgi:hypothetical protein